MESFEVASIYCREIGSSKVKWENGPYELNRAMAEIEALVQEELDYLNDPKGFSKQRVQYFELRGLGGCSVRYRANIRQGQARVEYVPLSPATPGRRPRSVG